MEHFSQSSHCGWSVCVSLVRVQPCVQLNENLLNFVRFKLAGELLTSLRLPSMDWTASYVGDENNIAFLIWDSFLQLSLILSEARVKMFHFFIRLKLRLELSLECTCHLCHFFNIFASNPLCTSYLIYMWTKNIVQEVKTNKAFDTALSCILLYFEPTAS